MWLCTLGIIMVLAIWANKWIEDDYDKAIKQIDEDYDKAIEKINDKYAAIELEEVLCRHRKGMSNE